MEIILFIFGFLITITVPPINTVIGVLMLVMSQVIKEKNLPWVGLLFGIVIMLNCHAVIFYYGLILLIVSIIIGFLQVEEMC